MIGFVSFERIIAIETHLHHTKAWYVHILHRIAKTLIFSRDMISIVTSFFLPAYQDLIDDKDTTRFLGFPKSFWTHEIWDNQTIDLCYTNVGKYVNKQLDRRRHILTKESACCQACLVFPLKVMQSREHIHTYLQLGQAQWIPTFEFCQKKAKSILETTFSRATYKAISLYFLVFHKKKPASQKFEWTV